MKINNSIKQLEKKKVMLLAQMGSMAFEKIRKNTLIDGDFDNIQSEILEIDKLIYEEMVEIDKLNKFNLMKKCECGNDIEGKDKFCSVCGKNVENDEEELIICSNCNFSIDIDSNYCTCCGNEMYKHI